MSTKNAVVSYLDDHGIVMQAVVNGVSPKRLIHIEQGILEVLNKQSETQVVVPADRLLAIVVVEEA